MSQRVLSIFIWFWILVIPLSYNVWGLDPALYSKFLLLDVSLLIAALILAIKPTAESHIGNDTLRFIQLYGAYIFTVSLILYCINLPDGIFTWLHLFTLPAFVLLLLVINSGTAIRREQVALAISCMAGLSITIGIWQYVTEILSAGWYMAASDVMRATFAHKNIFSEILLLTLPFSFFAGFGAERKRHLPKVIFVLTILTIVLLLSRAVWLGFGAAVLVTALFYFFATGKWKPGIKGAIAIVLCAGVSYVLYRWFIKHTNAGEYVAYFYNKRNTVKERSHLWSATWQMIKWRLPFGSGMGSWKVLNMRYAIVGLRDYKTFFQQPHNDYLWVLSEQGLLAFLAAGAAWLFVLYKLLRQILAKPMDMFLYCLLFVLVGYGVYANLAFPKERAEHGIILAFVVFFILSGDARTIALPRYAMWCVCCVIAIGAWWSGNKMMNEIHLREFFEAREMDNLIEQRAQLNDISRTYWTVDGTATPIAWYSGMLRFAQGDMAGAAKDFDQAVRVNPYHAYSLSNVAVCKNLNGDKAGAMKYFRLALDYSPGFPDAALNMCAILYNDGKVDSASTYLGMVNDTLTNERYVRSLAAVSLSQVKLIRQSTPEASDSAVAKKLDDLLKKQDWQMEIFQKAYQHHRSIKEQVLMDIAWTLRNQDHDTISALRLEKVVGPQPE
jgi:O-antigen ligase/lipoprotein NlpI